MMTLGSLFDGSGGFPLGGLLAGITPVWASEIEPFPIRVTTKRLPFMKHYGDISTLDGGKIEPVDIITFGSPCQDMSVAGRRDGLDGSRSSLFYEAIRIIKEMRYATNGKYPRYIVWENVPGAFSSNGGEDFKAVLEAVIDVAEPNTQVPMPEKNRWPYADCYMGDGWSVAYRVLDAQFWGVPQRRKRIYLVADFAGGRAFDILFKSEGLSGYSAEGFRSWQRTAGSAADCTGTASLCLNDQGGQRMDVTDDVTATLRAEAHHPPCVLESAGFCTEHSAKSRSIGYEEETLPTLRAGVVPAAVALENHPTDSRVKIAEDGKVQTLTSRMGTGGNNVPLVMKIRSGCEGGGKGPLIQTDKSATLSCNNDQTLFEPKAYGICSKESNAMKSDNPHSGIYEAETSRTLDGNGGNPACNQGSIAVVCVDQGGGKSSCNISEDISPTLACTHGGEPVVAFAQNQRDEVRDLGEKSACLSAEPGMKQQTYVLQGNMIGRKDENGSQGSGVNEDVSFTLDATDRHAVAYGIDRAAFNQGQNAKFGFAVETDVQPTIVAKGPGVVAQDEAGYTVRRLTPTECARLQGFPDWWCDDLGIEPTTDDLRYWYDVFETHRRIVGGSSKPKSLKQITKWLRDPHSDAAEYKMWGNGVALPCVWFVLCGIVWANG